jgi:hypothetical protein
MAMQTRLNELDELANALIMREVARNPFLMMAAMQSNLFGMAAAGSANADHEDHFLVGCATCGTDMCMEHSTIYNCELCGEMFYCSPQCELRNRQNHDCVNWVEVEDSDNDLPDLEEVGSDREYIEDLD